MPSVGIYLRGRIQVIRVSDNGQFDVGSPDLHIEEVGCAVCGADGSRRIFTEHYRLGPDDHEYELGVNRCLTCGQVYVSPRLDESSTEVVYRLDTERTISHAYCWAGQTSDHRFEPLLDRITKRVPNGRMLDVGCGTGSFLSAASRRQRWELTGLEPVESAARLAANNAHGTIHRCTLEEAHLPSQHYDVVALLGVLEHLHSPADTLQSIHRILRPGGYLAVYVPNFRYLRLKDTGPACWLRSRRWSNLSPQEHLFHFTPGLLRQILGVTGFEVDRIDVGRPFLGGSRTGRMLKTAAYFATVAFQKTTGVHFGGLETLARRLG